jgi:sialate O-acetylesterase
MQSDSVIDLCVPMGHDNPHVYSAYYEFCIKETIMRMRIRLLILAIGFTPGLAQAEVKPHALCSEGMVLQQKAKAKIWGTAEDGEKITVTFRDKSVETTANKKGNWLVEVATGEAGGPFEMTIAGANAITYKNVLVGEVWICSGQSNMEWSVGNCDKNDKEFASSAPHNPMLRMFTVKRTYPTKPQADTAGNWVDAKPETVNGFSAVGYFFGRNLQESRKVPVGLIHTSWGGTRAEAWTSKTYLDALPAFRFEHEKLDPLVKAYEANSDDKPTLKNPMHPNAASALYNGMINPLLNYRIKGAIWYQGESNSGLAYAYQTLFPLMILNWRADWKQGNFPFYFVQLAPFTSVNKTPGESNWAELREAQTMTLKLKNTGMAVITDYGSEYDIHPTPKRPVGERLALAARAQTYGEKIVYSGPMYKEVKFNGNKAILSFDHVHGGLVTNELVPTLERKDKNGTTLAAWRVKEGSTGAPLVGFTICGNDKVFQEAKAEIDGDKVVVTCEKVENPIAVRYGWANHPICNLFNREGLPASPFRTDIFRGITQPKQ